MEPDIRESGPRSATGRDDIDAPVKAAGPEDNADVGWPGTGDPRVDRALRGLGGLSDLPVAEHAAVFERIHGELVEVLGELRSGSDKGAHGRQDD